VPLFGRSAEQNGSYSDKTWSGYVDTQYVGGYVSVEAAWQIPCIKSPGDTAVWAGIGGYNGSTHLVQAGSTSDGSIVNGVLQTHYWLWMENTANSYPGAIQVLPANCSDTVYVMVFSSGRMFVENVTQN